MGKLSTAVREAKKAQLAILKQMVQLATSGFGLVAALAWNNVIQEFVDGYVKKYFAEGSSLISLFVYAIGITILAVLITLQLSSMVKKIEGTLSPKDLPQE